MRNLSLPNSEAAAVQSRAGPGPSAASREAAPLTGCGAKLRRFAGVIHGGGSGGGETGHLLLGLRLLGLLAPGEGQRDRLRGEVAALDEPFVVLL
jgi:hypothetical protein